jgi:hypothetical protein
MHNGLQTASMDDSKGFILNSISKRINPRDQVYRPSAVYLLDWKYSGGVISLLS